MLELGSQLPDVLRLKMTNQMDGRHSALRILLDLQFPIASVAYLGATGMPTQTIESVEVTTRKITELSGILIVQKNWRGIVAGGAEAARVYV